MNVIDRKAVFLKKKVGIIGYGSMGSMLLNGFIDSNIISPSNLFVSTKTKEKLSLLKDEGVNICLANNELIDMCDLIFICVKPLEFKDVLDEVINYLSLSKHIISIAGSLTISHLEKFFNGKITRILPTLVSEIKMGITLVTHNAKVTSEDIIFLDELLKSISDVRVIPESEFELVSVLTSCAPGLISAIFREYVNSALIHSNMSKEDIINIVSKTLYGTSKLFIDKNYSFDEMIKRVATKGGATEGGVQVLENRLPDVFNEMFLKTFERNYSRKLKIDGQFDEK
jgi:pyrroline-5-carboxylate reductase